MFVLEFVLTVNYLSPAVPQTAVAQLVPCATRAAQRIAGKCITPHSHGLAFLQSSLKGSVSLTDRCCCTWCTFVLPAGAAVLQALCGKLTDLAVEDSIVPSDACALDE
jgi:hypothetical protein